MKRKLSSRQTLLKFIETYKEHIKISDETDLSTFAIDFKKFSPYLTKTFLHFKDKPYILTVSDTDMKKYGLNVYARTMTDKMMLSAIQEIAPELVKDKDEPFLNDETRKALFLFASELDHENVKRTNLKIMYAFLKEGVKVSQAIKTNDVMHDFELETCLGVLTCRVIKESVHHATDKKGTWGVNPISFRLKKETDEK